MRPTGRDRQSLLIQRHLPEHPQRLAASPSELTGLVAVDQQWVGVAGSRVAKDAILSVEDAVNEGDVHARLADFFEVAVHGPQGFAWGPMFDRLEPQRRAGQDHIEGSRHAFITHIPNYNPNLAAGEGDKVVKIAADHAGRDHQRANVQVVVLGQALRQEALLDFSGQLKLVLDLFLLDQPGLGLLQLVVGLGQLAVLLTQVGDHVLVGLLQATADHLEQAVGNFGVGVDQPVKLGDSHDQHAQGGEGADGGSMGAVLAEDAHLAQGGARPADGQQPFFARA